MRAIDRYSKHSLSRIHSDWACLVGQEYRLDEPEFHREAWDFACQIMRRAKSHILDIIEQLQRENYSFLDPGEIYSQPEAGVQEGINDLTSQGIHLPLSLAAWLCEVGTVNLMGSHPDWPTSGYLEGKEPVGTEPFLADPLFVELPLEFIEYLHDDWKNSEDTEHPFRVDVAPDHLHKANVSGGLPYQLKADRPCIDGLLLNERHSTTFVSYLRIAIQWAGFPGLDYLQEAGLGRRMAPPAI